MNIDPPDRDPYGDAEPEPEKPRYFENRNADEYVVVEERLPRTLTTSAEVILRTAFRDIDVSGIDKANILTCADLAYIHHFERAFAAVEVLAERFKAGMALHGEVAADLYSYMRNRPHHLAPEDRHAATARVFEHGLKERVEELDEALMAFYRASSPGAAFDAGDAVPPEAPRAAAVWLIEIIQRLLSRSGGGAGHFVAFQAGQQLVKCFRILGAEELTHHLGGDYDDGVPGNIERLVPSGGTADAPGMTGFQVAKLAVESRQMIRLLADFDVADPPSDADLISLSARLTLLRTVSGEHRQPKQVAAQLTDLVADRGTTIIQMSRRTA